MVLISPLRKGPEFPNPDGPNPVKYLFCQTESFPISRIRRVQILQTVAGEVLFLPIRRDSNQEGSLFCQSKSVGIRSIGRFQILQTYREESFFQKTGRVPIHKGPCFANPEGFKFYKGIMTGPNITNQEDTPGACNILSLEKKLLLSSFVCLVQN